MKNLLLENVEYKIETTSFGSWRRYVYPTTTENRRKEKHIP